MAFEKPLVFISCGQYNDTEKRLGKDICSLLASLRPDVNPYFAEDQSTVGGLSSTPPAWAACENIAKYKRVSLVVAN
jgi:hypothetical protein